MFRDRVASDPVRFARFASSMNADVSQYYTVAMLMGLGNVEFAPSDLDTRFDAVRYLGALGQPETDRWLGLALQKPQRLVPMDLIQLILDRAIHSLDD